MKRLHATLRWLPMLAPACIAVFYATSVAAGPHLFDAGELAAAAWDLAGSHPPGQPVHALVARAACMLPFGPIPARIALLSVVCLWLAAIATGRATRIVCIRLRDDPDASAGGSASWAGNANWADLAATATGVSVMLAPPLVRQATRVEVYTLALALCAWSILELVRWAFDGGRGPLLRAALVAGLCASVHPPHALSAVVLGAVVALSMRRDALRQPATLAMAALAALMSLIATSAYLPLRAFAGASMWGDPTTGDGLLAYLSARTFQGKTFAGQQGGYLDALVDYARHGTLAVGVIPLLSALWLCGRQGLAGQTGRVLLAAAALSIAGAAIQPLQTFIPDHVAYLGPAILLITIGGVTAFVMAMRGRSGAQRGLLATGMTLAALNPAFAPELAVTARADLPALETLASSLTQTPPPRALVVTTTDFTGASWVMARSIDGARPDVALFLSGFVTSTWMWKQLSAHPAFDGRPQRGEGRGARQAYFDGLMRSALGRVPIALERDAPRIGPAPIAGSYVLLDPGHSTQTQARIATSIGERLIPVLAIDAAHGPAGDHGSGDAIIRQHELVRARRLLQRSLTVEGLRGLTRAGQPIPPALVPAAMFSQLAQAELRRPVPVVKAPLRFTVGAADVQRELAVELWRHGRSREAAGLLEWQARGGDPRALLQQGWLALASGDLDGAQGALTAFLKAAPHLAEEARALYGQLQTD